MPRIKSDKVIEVLPLEVAKEREDSKAWSKDKYISEISKASNRWGDKLLHLMDLNKANNLAVITVEQARDYYHKYILDIN